MGLPRSAKVCGQVFERSIAFNDGLGFAFVRFPVSKGVAEALERIRRAVGALRFAGLNSHRLKHLFNFVGEVVPLVPAVHRLGTDEVQPGLKRKRQHG
ncbi:hypothetical protein D9M70_517700 [compost metagenome]